MTSFLRAFLSVFFSFLLVTCCIAQTPLKGEFELPYEASLVEEILATAPVQGDLQQGAKLFSSARLACLQCHQVAGKGGTVGPDLTKLSERDFKHIVESVLWPKRDVKPEFVSWNIATEKGEILTGYKRAVDDKAIELFVPTSGKTVKIPVAEIDEEAEFGTLMPDGLTAALTSSERLSLFRFLLELGRTPAADLAASKMEVPRHDHTVISPAQFEFDLAPYRESDHPLWKDPVNKNRMYDFYAKEADYFRKQEKVPELLMDYPGLHGGGLGHWGRQTENDWRDERWNEMDRGTLQAGVFHHENQVVARGIAVRLGDHGEIAACFNPDTLKFEAVWKDGFFKTSPVRYGFLGGIIQDGTSLPVPEQSERPGKKCYQGLYRHGKRIIFAYRIGDVDYLDAPWVDAAGNFSREIAPVKEHSLRNALQGGSPQWPQRLTTSVELGSEPGYAIDTIQAPFENPWKALLYFGGVGFLKNGDAMLCTMQGDVWKVSGLSDSTKPGAKVVWKRYASGLHQALGLIVVDDVPYVLGRDMITRLHDFNGDEEADYYECFSKAFVTSPAAHDYICGLQRDDEGYFYIASGNQGLVKISPDGKNSQVIATGFRNPDGLGMMKDGRLTLPCSEGDWTPASMVCVTANRLPADGKVPHFGFLGPHHEETPQLPLVYLPRGYDNSSGGQTFVDSPNWGPMQNHLIHYSYGTGTAFLVLEDEVNGQIQGTAVPLPGNYRSGIHRGRVHPIDGQLYIAGMNGWTCFAPDDGCFQRLRYTGTPTQIPIASHVHENGIMLEFALPVDPDVATDVKKQFAQAWNYRYSRAYGSSEMSPTHRRMKGHDHVPIKSVTVLPDRRKIFIEIPTLQPVNQLHLQIEVNQGGRRQDLIATVHALDTPFTEIPGYQPSGKQIQPHPIVADMDLLNRQLPNPWRFPTRDATAVTISTDKNLTFKQGVVKVKAGDSLRFTLNNPDVVPHNWVLLKPGTLQKVGALTNGLIGDPDAYLRSYVPETDDVLVYTDIVDPGAKFTIFFNAPKEPGRYPYLCTFPGHWMVMNGVMIVE